MFSNIKKIDEGVRANDVYYGPRRYMWCLGIKTRKLCQAQLCLMIQLEILMGRVNLMG